MPLVVIESPNKIKKFQEYTGFKVCATGGHFRDLPAGGINVDLDTYEGVFEIIPGKEKNVAKLKEMAKGQTLYLASDPDREGEAISRWVEKETRGLYKEAFRIEVREITKNGIKHALTNAVPFAETNVGTFHAFMGRRITDRLVGYLLSPKASRELATKGLSIGRVQTVALRLVVEREKEIRAHKSAPYWFVTIEVAKDGQEFIAYHVNGRYDELTDAQKVIEKVSLASYATCKKVEKQTKKRNPSPPFTTASLQMASSTKLGIAPEKTMSLAQDLFEAGLITYHRTDSVRLADDIIDSIRLMVIAEYGKDCVPAKAFKHTAKNTQADAHEGIRPTSILPIANARKLLAAESLAGAEHLALYDLIWKRTIASQMSPSIYELTTVDLEVEGELFKGVGRVLVFDGFQRVYSVEDEEEKKGDDEQIIPFLEQEDLLAFRGEGLVEKKTKAPGRYSEAGLIEKLESLGVGRPSTYASILGSITRRGYVEVKKRMLVPTGIGENLFDWADNTCRWVVDYEMTKGMEETLDLVEQGKAVWQDFVRDVHERMGFEKPSQTLPGGDAPTEKQVAYAERIAKNSGANLPDKTKKSRKALSDWINKHKEPESDAKLSGLSEKQLKTIKNFAPAEVKERVAAGDTKAGKDFLDSHFAAK